MALSKTNRIIIETVTIAASSALIGGMTYGLMRHSKLNVSSKEEKITAFFAAFIGATVVHLIARNFIKK